MNPQSNYDNLRWCDRHKTTQVYQHVEAFAKKIRKRKKFQQQLINANTQQRQIDAFYKIGWQYEHAHSSISCDISDPIYVQQNIQQSRDRDHGLSKYSEDCANFISRLKAEHQDETAFRVETKQVELSLSEVDFGSEEQSEQKKKHYQNVQVSKQTYRNFMQTIHQAVIQMLNNIQQSSDRVMDQQNYPYFKYALVLETIKQWVQDCSKTDSDDEEGHKQVSNMHCFMANFINVAERMRKQSRSCLFNYLPSIEIMTYLVHPVLLGIYALYQKQKILWKNQYEHDILNINFNQKIESPHLLPDPPHFQVSRTVFINLVGYESEFNIQFAKNMQNHLMYISFPQFPNNLTDKAMSLNNRFYKKIMFNSTREMYEYEPEDYDVIENRQLIHTEDDGNSQIDTIRKQIQIKYDPQKYYQSISKIFKDKEQAKSTKNIHILPISFKYLQQQMSTSYQDTRTDASQYPSHFVDFMLSQVLADEISKFSPNMVIISYNGNITIKDSHWVNILRLMAKLSNRKMLLFPNFTTSLVNPEVYENMEEPIYDNFAISDTSIRDSCNIDLMRKFSQFLKISSGTYNLQTPREKQTLLPRLKLVRLHSYIRGLLTALSQKQYTKLKDKYSDLILRCQSIIVNRSIQQSIKQIRNSIPHYYQQLIRNFKQIISQQSNKFPKHLTERVASLRHQIRAISDGNPEMRDRYIQDLLQKLQIQFSSQKHSELAYIYLKTKDEKDQYKVLKQFTKSEQKQQGFNINRKQNNLSGMYQLTLRYTNFNRERSWIPITQKTQIIYKVDQRHRINTKKTANIMVINHLQTVQFMNYAGLVTLAQQEGQKNRMVSSRVDMYPIVFNNTPQLQYNQFTVRSNWSYGETSNHYILYWPQQYNILQAKIKQANQQIYQPNILNEIYVCSSNLQSKQHRLVFNFVQTDQTAIPRKFCNALDLPNCDKLIIFGGFYEKQFDYLSLQTNITGFDFTNYSDDNHKCNITNQKGTMYQIAIKNPKNKQIRSYKNTNSYIRARRDCQFYDLGQLCPLNQQQILQLQNGIRTYVMIGGFGEDFVRPYSLMNCSYFMVKVNLQTKSIVSISRKFVYEKMMTSNIKGFIKNNGFFQKLSRYERNSLLRPDQFISPDDYIAHRSVYSIIREQNKPQQLMAKSKYFFALNLYNNYKKQYLKLATKIGQYIDNKTNETSQFFLSVASQGNHYLTIRQSRSRQWINQIYLQKPEGKNKFTKVPLTHGSICSIDIKFKHIYAIVKHDYFTNSKFVLTQCEMPSGQAEVVLKILHTFNQNLSQHNIFIPRPGEVVVLHGITFSRVAGMTDFVYKVPKKDNGKQNPIRNIAYCASMDAEKYRKCYTLMMKDQNQSKNLEVDAINFMLPVTSKPNSYFVSKQRLRISSLADYLWQNVEEYQIFFIDEQSKSSIHIVKVQQLRYNPNPLQPINSYSSPTLSHMMCKNSGCIVAKVTALDKNTYIGLISSPHLKYNQGEIIKMSMIVSDNRQAKKVWEMLTPVHSHLKTIQKYQDMDVNVHGYL